MSSDYTPPNLVKPTPGGNPGDGSINGNLNFTKDQTGIVFAGGGKFVQDDYAQSGGLSIWSVNGWRQIGFEANGYLDILGQGVTFHSLVAFGAGAYINQYKGINTVGFGVAPLFGKDVRTGLTAADASATTLYTTTAAGQVYEVAARIFGTGGTITSGVYTIGWTEGGVARTATVSVTAAGTLASAVFLLQPDSGTAITAQLTTLSGTSPVANVAAVVKQDV